MFPTCIDQNAVFYLKFSENSKYHKHFLTQMSTDNQLRKHISILTVFASSDERVLLTMLSAELNNRSHGTADFQYIS